MSATDLDAASPVTATGTGATGAGSRWAAVSCRALDIVLSVPLLLVLAPVFALIALTVRLDSPGRAIYRQKRLGRDLEAFTILKFRSMRTDAGDARHREYVVGLIHGTVTEAGDGSMFKLTQDDRVTRVGAFLRRTSLDELPQIWNVLRGEMSLVGPRPPLHYEVEEYRPAWFGRFAVKPGLTGLWQVSGRSDLTWEESLRLDLWYVDNWSLALDLQIIFRTARAVLRGTGAY
jgi:exopolysaccharide biosynthesis polyprenyl glycosylphosphotransferase